MSWLVFVMCLVISIIINLKIFKDFMYPGVLFCLPWLVFSLILPISKLNFNASSNCYLYLAFGVIVFEIGCFFIQKKIMLYERLQENKYKFKVNYSILKLLMCIEIIFLIFVLYRYYTLIHHNYTINVLQTYSLNKKELGNEGLIFYGRNVFLALGISIIIGYSRIENEEKDTYRKYMIFQTIIMIIMAITRMSRNGMLFSMLPILISYIIVTRQQNKKVIKKILLFFILFLILFLGFSVLKFFYEYTDKSSYINNFKKQFLIYGCGGIIAIQQMFDTGNIVQYNGLNTFRFFIAIYDKIFCSNYAKPLVQDFISIGNGVTTNVYTFYQYYINDFGYIYAILMQFLTGIFHGISYKKMSQMKNYWIYIFSFSIYPLVMQFFQDQYISLISTWIQILILGFIFLKTNLIFCSYAIQERQINGEKNE